VDPEQCIRVQARSKAIFTFEEEKTFFKNQNSLKKTAMKFYVCFLNAVRYIIAPEVFSIPE
jgi:hypothetical protein